MLRWLPAATLGTVVALALPACRPGSSLSVTSGDPASAAQADPKAEWPGWLGPARDGKSPDKGLLKQWPAGGPKLIWKVTGIGRGFSSPTVAGGMVYITGIVGGNTVLRALDLSGKPVWQVQHGSGFHNNVPGSRSSAVVDGGLLYLVGDTGLVACYDAKTGARKWSHQMSEYGGRTPDWGYAESVLVYKDLAIITPGGERCIVALNKKTGDTVWTSSGFSAGAQYGSCIAVTFGGVPMVIAGSAAGIVAVDARNGTGLWGDNFAAGNTANCNTPAYSDGYVFWAAGYGKGGVCLKLSAAGGRVTAQRAWTTRDMDCHHGGYVISDGCVYGNHGGRWACLDLATGQTKWSEQAVGKGSICWADGMLYLFSENGGRMGLATCSPSGCRMKGEFSVEGRDQSWAHPVVIGGRLYVRYDDNLYCFDVKGG